MNGVKIWNNDDALESKGKIKTKSWPYINGLERCNSIANTLELCLSCSSPAILWAILYICQNFRAHDQQPPSEHPIPYSCDTIRFSNPQQPFQTTWKCVLLTDSVLVHESKHHSRLCFRPWGFCGSFVKPLDQQCYLCKYAAQQGALLTIWITL